MKVHKTATVLICFLLLTSVFTSSELGSIRVEVHASSPLPYAEASTATGPSIQDFGVSTPFTNWPASYIYCENAVANGWSNAANVYDNNTNTYADYTVNSGPGWTPELVLNFSSPALSSSVYIDFFDNGAGYFDQMEINSANQTGIWFNVYNSSTYGLGANGNRNVTVTQSYCTAFEFRFHSSTIGGPLSAYFYEARPITDIVYPLFSFKCSSSDGASLTDGVLQTNTTGSDTNATVILSGESSTADFYVTYPLNDCAVSFQFWVNDSQGNYATTSLKTINVYNYANSVTYFGSLAQAITAIQSANAWNQVDSYDASILRSNVTSLQSMIDNYCAESDWVDVLKWSAFCNKIWGADVPPDVMVDINYALNNFPMLNNTNLPQTATISGVPCLLVYDRWSLFGYYFASQPWALSYNSAIGSKWNTTAAYSKFDALVNYSTSHSPPGLPLYIYATTARTFSNRYYDEDAETVSFYILFAELLNVSDAMKKAAYWWNYLVSIHWNGSYFGYTNANTYECEEPFFLKIISQLKYYNPNIQNWNDVLTDIQNRFLASEWNSPQWSDYVVVHASTNLQKRLDNTLGAWQVMLGVYSQLDGASQSNMLDMLVGNQSIQPAWALLLNPAADLFNSLTDMFKMHSDSSPNDPTATSEGEILLFLLGIIPISTTIALPLEELEYQYLQDIDPQMFQFDTTARSITIPVDGAGNICFQYGASPITATFDQPGIWQITFSNSWNMITNMTYLSALPTACRYFTQLYSPLPYNVTIDAYSLTEATDVNVPVTVDGLQTAYTTPHTFTFVGGTHTLTVPDNASNNEPFKEWSTNLADNTIFANSTGTYTAYYGPPQIHSVKITDIELSKTIIGQGYNLYGNITTTNLGDYPETFNITISANATEIGNLTVSNMPNRTSTFIYFTWNTSGYSYGYYSIIIYAFPSYNETGWSDVKVSNSICVSIPGDLNGDFQVNLADLVILAKAYNTQANRDTVGTGYHQYNPNADIDGNGVVNLSDLVLLATHYGQHYT